ncbi:MAG: chemotaxis protein CheW [Nitrospirota bacterium]
MNGNEQNLAVGDGGGSQLVTFCLGDEEYAVDILSVREINRLVPITKVPKTPFYVDGVINLRGKVIPVIDLKKKLGLPETERTARTRVVVIEAGPRTCGVVVDSVSEVLRISAQMIEPAPPFTFGIDPDLIKGVCKVEDRLIMLLDVKAVSMGDGEMPEAA